MFVEGGSKKYFESFTDKLIISSRNLILQNINLLSFFVTNKVSKIT